MRTSIYIDGFNLYYSAVKGTPYKWLDSYDCALIVSNDSDLAEAMRLIKAHHPQKRLGLVFPGEKGKGRYPSRELVTHSDFVKHLGHTLLASCQLPDPIPGTSIRKPATW